MVNLDKVIKGLEICTKNESFAECVSKECPFIGGSIDGNCIEMLMHNALALLKEQEPVVRCSECKYAHMTYDGECKYCDFWQEDGGDALYLDKGFYCAAGERRDGET